MERIESFTAYVAEDATGEGLMAFLGPDGSWVPMVAADEKRIESLYPVAVSMAEKQGVELKILQFTTRTDITDQIKEKYGNANRHPDT